jgi:hypothetical protein
LDALVVGSLEEVPPDSPLDETYTEVSKLSPSKQRISCDGSRTSTPPWTRIGLPHHPNEETDVPGVERDFDQIIHSQDVSTNISTNIQGVSTNITTNISRIHRVSLAEGWDANTTAKAMSDNLLLGLRDGFCGLVGRCPLFLLGVPAW